MILESGAVYGACSRCGWKLHDMRRLHPEVIRRAEETGKVLCEACAVADADLLPGVRAGGGE